MELSEKYIEIAEGLTFIAVYALNEIRKHKKSEKEKKEKEQKEIQDKMEVLKSYQGIEKTQEVDIKVKHLEQRFINEIKGVCRVLVIHFHNGTFTEAGLSLYKITMKHEVKRIKFSVMSENHTGIPVPEYLYHMIGRVAMRGYHYIDDSDKVRSKNVHFYEWLEHYQIKSMYSTEIKKNGKLTAILCVMLDTPNILSDKDKVSINEDKKSIEFIYNNL